MLTPTVHLKEPEGDAGHLIHEENRFKFLFARHHRSWMFAHLPLVFQRTYAFVDGFLSGLSRSNPESLRPPLITSLATLTRRMSWLRA